MPYLLVGYMWLFIHRPFEIWPWLGDLHIERLYIILVAIYWALVAPKTWTSNRINIGIGCLAVTIFLATFFSIYVDYSSNTMQSWIKVLVFYILVMTSIKNEKELRLIIISFIVILGVYELHSLREYIAGRGAYQMATWRMVGVDIALNDPNSFAASVNYGIPFMLPVLTIANKKWHRIAILCLFFLAASCILLTGSRTGIICFIFTLTCIVIVSKYRWKLLPLIGVSVLLVIWMVLSQDLGNRYLTIIDPSIGPDNAQVSAESRKELFFIALDIWKEHPVFGVGPGGFSLASKTGLQSHTLYAQTISELGFVGALSFLWFLYGFFKNYFESRRIYKCVAFYKYSKFYYNIMVAVMVSVLQLLLNGLGGHNLFRYNWLWLAAFSALSLKFLAQKGIITPAKKSLIYWLIYQYRGIRETYTPKYSGHCKRIKNKYLGN